MTQEEIDDLTRAVNAVDDLIQANRKEYLKIIGELKHHNIASKQVVGTLHLLMKHPILELLSTQDSLVPKP